MKPWPPKRKLPSPPACPPPSTSCPPCRTPTPPPPRPLLRCRFDLDWDEQREGLTVPLLGNRRLASGKWVVVFRGYLTIVCSGSPSSWHTSIVARIVPAPSAPSAPPTTSVAPARRKPPPPKSRKKPPPPRKVRIGSARASGAGRSVPKHCRLPALRPPCSALCVQRPPPKKPSLV